MTRNTQFDYIVVGAGSAGCVVANKLGEAHQGKYSILVIEAGPMDYNLMIHIPAGVYSAWRNPAINWNYKTEAQEALLQRSIDMPRGKVLGGSSSINSMVYMRGHPLDYEHWATLAGLEHWRYADCLPYFRSGETSDRGESTWRGGSGPLGVTQGRYENALYDAFIDAGEQAGQGCTDDPSGFNPEGVARLDATRRHGRRCSAAVAHLRPALKRGNVTLLNNALVERVLFDGDRACGIAVKHQGQSLSFSAEREVILSGGAINSPQLLMLSGIGPPDHLRKLGITPRLALPSVGQHLQDHAAVILQFESKKSFPIHKVAQPHRKLAAGIKWVFTRGGIASSNIWEAGGLVRGNTEVAYPNLQYHFGPVGFEYRDNVISLSQAFAIHVDQLRPESRGAVTLKSADPEDAPELSFNYFAVDSDLQQLVEGVKKTRDLVAQSAFDSLRGKEIEPGAQVQSDKDIRRWIRQTMSTDFHPCGTCRMGTGDDAVVDAQMRVRGCTGLRVVDASVMPRILSGNLNAPTQMLAARAADYILDQPQLEPEFATFAFQSG
ncbi:MAG: choline dehydrogenase [Gammaproteobacteria bacterium]|nr:choline dehydrogenase [Gammaproteobacteria bacterium]